MYIDTNYTIKMHYYTDSNWYSSYNNALLAGKNNRLYKEAMTYVNPNTGTVKFYKDFTNQKYLDFTAEMLNSHFAMLNKLPQ